MNRRQVIAGMSAIAGSVTGLFSKTKAVAEQQIHPTLDALHSVAKVEWKPHVGMLIAQHNRMGDFEMFSDRIYMPDGTWQDHKEETDAIVRKWYEATWNRDCGA